MDNNILNELQAQINQIKQQNPNLGAVVENPDISKWEMDTSPFIDNLKAHLLGMSKNGEIWEDVEGKEQVMNSFGVDRFITELETRISIHMQMSELDKQEIKVIVADAGMAFGDLLEDNWERWDIKPKSLSSELMSIGTMFEHALWILLNIAKNAGMRTHREQRGIKTYSQPPPPEAY